MKQLLYLFVLCWVFSCEDANAKKTYKANSSGIINSLLVVMDDELWSGPVGDAVRTNIGSEIYGLPQAEPQFDLRQVPIRVFSDFVRLNRTVLKVCLAEKVSLKYYKNPYATPQRMAVVSAPDLKALIGLIQDNAQSLITNFKSLEFKEKQRLIDKALFKSERIEATLKIKLRFSTAYRIAKAEGDFFWIRRDTKTGSLNMLLYSLPLEDFKTRKALSEFVFQKRDSIGKKFIPGPVEGNFMTTERAYKPIFKSTTLSGFPALETRSLWKIEGAFMSGPFVNYCIEDKKNNRFLVADGFVYAPSVRKRDYMFELETMIRSIRIQ